MRVGDLFAETGSALEANRGRSLLTVLGIVIGIAAVIAMTAMIGGIRQSIMTDMGAEQARLVNIYAWGDGRSLTIDDAKTLSEDLAREYEYITTSQDGYFKVSADGGKEEEMSIQGAEKSYFDLMRRKPSQGRLFSRLDNETAANVAVIDQHAARILFGAMDADVVGKTIKIEKTTFEIVGMMESRSTDMSGTSGMCWVPLETCAKRLNKTRDVYALYGFMREEVDLDTVKAKTVRAIGDLLDIPMEDREDSVYVQPMEEIINQVNSMMASFGLLMTSVASISLLVGGIGIMNMMLTNVTERIREIGLRKALGARRFDIVSQFLLESVCLCLVGGALGILLGYGGSFALMSIAGDTLSEMVGTGSTTEIKPVIDLSAVFAAAGISAAIGILFGFYPARRAAKLDPVESLHYQ